MKETVAESFEILQQKWLACMDMLLELKKNGFSVPRAVEHLRHVKSMINEASLNKAADEEFFARAESLMDEALREVFMFAEPLGEEFLEKWDSIFRRIMKGEKYGEFKHGTSVFYPHLPRGNYYVRVKWPENVTPQRLREIAKSNGVYIKRHQEQHIVITGEKEKVRKALMEIAVYIKGEL